MIERKVYSVSQINRYIRSVIENDVILNSIWVRGEVSNLKVHSSGHIYFTLKDYDGAINAIMFDSYAQLMPYEIENGMDLIVCGYISVYEKTGKYQLYVQIAEPAGAGSLSVAFEQLKKKLEAEGLFDDDFKREIPEHPTNVAVITSPSGAAVRDIINVIQRRDPSVRIIVIPILVQGENAADSIVRGIRDANEYGVFDTIILGRGGGSAEDLWAFNEEKVARAIFASEIPVISAVGHETDFTISDFVSDLRAPTPSAAAELCVSDSLKEKRNIISIIERLNNGVLSKLRFEQQKTEQLFSSRQIRRLEERIANEDINTDKMKMLLEKNMDLRFKNYESMFELNNEKLKLLSPLNVLQRGYAAVFDKDNKAVVSAKSILAGDLLSIRFADGSITAIAEKRDMDYGKEKEII